MLHVQMTATQELRLSSDTTPKMYAETTFNMMASFPTYPLNEALDPEQLKELKATYMPEAIAMAKAMQTHDGSIALHYTMQWAVAVA